jgi:hypothetical protein
LIIEFITLDDIDPDETARVNQYHVDEANRFVNRLIKSLGKDPQTILDDEDQGPHVSGLAMAKALHLAYMASIVGEDSEHADKAEAKGKEFDRMLKDVTLLIYDRPMTIPIGRA